MDVRPGKKLQGGDMNLAMPMSQSRISQEKHHFSKKHQNKETSLVGFIHMVGRKSNLYPDVFGKSYFMVFFVVCFVSFFNKLATFPPHFS